MADNLLRHYWKPIESLITDPSVSDIFIDGHDRVYVERRSALFETDCRWDTEDQFLAALDHIARPQSQPFDYSNPILDAQLWDGSRLSASRAPYVPRPQATIRVYRVDVLKESDLLANGTLTRTLLDYLYHQVSSRANVLITGVPGSGKTTLLRILALPFMATDRTITIEDTRELALPVRFGYSAEVAPRDGQEKLSMRVAVKKALRDKPHRLVVGEIRTPDALQTLLESIEAGFSGALSTLHCSSAHAAIDRMERLLMREKLFADAAAYRPMIQGTINLIVHCVEHQRLARRVVQEVVEVTPNSLKTVFSYDVASATHIDHRVLSRLPRSLLASRYAQHRVLASLRAAPCFARLRRP